MNSTRQLLRSLAATLGTAALCATTPLMAQESSAPVAERTTPSQTAPTPASPELSAERGPATPVQQQKIEQFADAYVAVQTIQSNAASEVQSAKDPAAAEQVKAKVENDMISAVERTGLKLEEFNQIVTQLASDNDLRTRVAAEVQKRVRG